MAVVSGNGHVNINNILANKKKFICINSSRKDEHWSANKIKMILLVA
jgi:hypothetical protein